MLTVKPDSLVLFIGDSVTDCGRRREDPDDLGPSYARKVRQYLDIFCGERHIRVLNRGISGNRVRDLKARWQEDCLGLHPDVVNILIGINDTWRRYDSADPTSPQAFEADYRDILSRTAAAGVQISIMEPFLMPHIADRQQWREDLDPKIQVVRRLAREFHATFIPLDGIFASCCTRRDIFELSQDGVHPVDGGHSVIARAWLSAVGLLRP